MADMRIREKVMKISEAAKHGEKIADGPKKMGMLVFLLLFGCGLIVLFALAIGLVMNEHLIGAGAVFLIASLLTYSIFKMLKADDIRKL